MAVTTSAVIGAVAAVGGVVSQRNAARSAEESQTRASEAAIAEQRAAGASFERRTQPFADIGLAAANPLRELLGLPTSTQPQSARLGEIQGEIESLDRQISEFQPVSGTTSGAPGFPRPRDLLGGTKGGATGVSLEDLNARRAALIAESEGITSAIEGEFIPAGQSQLEEINPILSFLRDEGFESIQETAAARGRLGAGGTLKDLTRFNTNLSATIVPQLQQQRFNQLFNLLGLGSNAATGQGTAALGMATNVSNLLGQQGRIEAQGSINRSNVATNALGQLSRAAGFFGQQNQNQNQNQNSQPSGSVNPQDFSSFA